MRVVALLSLCAIVAIACSGSSNSGGGATSGGTCAWHGNCSSAAPNGAYDCANDSELMQCVNGQWQHVADCATTQTSSGYYCNCKGGCGTNTVECSYAFNVCEAQSYPTCGPNAHPVITTAWTCQSGSS